MSRTYRLSADRKFLFSAGAIDIPYGPDVPAGVTRAALSRVRGRAATIIVPPGGGNAELERRMSLVYGTYKPGPGDVGPYDPAAITQTTGTSTTQVDFNVTANNQIIENRTIWGNVNIGTFTNVEIRNCIIRGGLARGTNRGYIQAPGDNLQGAWIHDNLIMGRPITVPATYNGKPLTAAGRVDTNNVWNNDGVRAGNCTIERNEFTRTGDGVGLTSKFGNVQILGNWIHRGGYCEWTIEDGTGSYTVVENGVTVTKQGAGFYLAGAGGSLYLHNDCIQTHQGTDYLIKGNNLGGTDPVYYNHNTGHGDEIIANNLGYYNTGGVMLKQEGNGAYVPIERLTIENNWIAGGVCGINFPGGAGNTFSTTYIKNNRFERRPNTWGSNTFYILTPLVGGTPTLANAGANISGNVFDDNGTPIPLSDGG